MKKTKKFKKKMEKSESAQRSRFFQFFREFSFFSHLFKGIHRELYLSFMLATFRNKNSFFQTFFTVFSFLGISECTEHKTKVQLLMYTFKKVFKIFAKDGALEYSNFS